MAVRRIILYPAATLLQKSEPFDFQKPQRDIHKLVTDMTDTMLANGGVGLSAIQIGVPLRVMVLQTPFGPQELINPHHIIDGVPRKVLEGCLSFPGIWEEVERWSRVSGLGYAANGERYQFHLNDEIVWCPLAHAYQHEYEHFDGITIANKVSEERVKEIRAQAISQWK